MNVALVIIILFGSYFRCGRCDLELTVKVEPGSEECFYETLQAGKAFELDYQVIDGGQGELDISFYLNSPDGRPVLMDYKQPDNSHRVEVPLSGPYRFCFDNKFSTFNKKTVFFALFSEEEDQDYIETADEEQYQIQVDQIEHVLLQVKTHMVQVRHIQEHIRAWEARDRNIAEGNFSRVNNWSLLQMAVMVAVGFVQVIMVKSLFDDQSKLNKLFRSRRTSKW